MANNSSKVLRANPFTAYRDPVTGKWVVVPAANSGGDPTLVCHLDKVARAVMQKETIDSLIETRA
jgi:hypothetical protein